MPAEVELYPYQKEDLETSRAFNGRFLLAWDMGLGKTLFCLKWLEREGVNAFPAVVVCPASVKYNWAYEAMHYLGIRASVCEGRTPPTVGAFESFPRITIINQDILHWWVPYLIQHKVKTVILDECQSYIHQTAKRTQAARLLVRGCKNLIASSGTPLTNRVFELWSVLNMLWPNEFPSEGKFQDRYCNRRLTPWGWDIKGSSNVGELRNRILKLGMLRRKKTDVLKDLPPKVWRTVPCEINMDEYREATDDFTSWLKQTGKVKSLKNEKLTRVGHLLRLAAKLKLRTPVEWANQFLSETDEKLIMFAVHHKAVDVLTRRIEFKSVKIDGTVADSKARQLAIEQFKTDPETRLFIGSSAGGVGVNGLQHAASEIGIVEFPQRPGDLTQWVSRAHRIGQKSTVFINMFVAVGTIEEDLVKILQQKQEVISSILDGEDAGEDLNLYEELLRVIEGRIL